MGGTLLIHAKALSITGASAYPFVMALLQEQPAVIDWSHCPLVEINPRKLSGVPVLKGTRMQADSILANYRSGLRADEIAEVFELPVESVRSLLVYAAEHHAISKP
jgi:uncharacterized protein (DUF433 family)